MHCSSEEEVIGVAATNAGIAARDDALSSGHIYESYIYEYIRGLKYMSRTQ